jgi:hypothetical protein
MGMVHSTCDDERWESHEQTSHRPTSRTETSFINRHGGKGGTEHERTPTLISRNGMSRLFSSLESRPSSLAARRKLRLVAASAFMAAAPPPGSNKRMRKDHERPAAEKAPAFLQRRQEQQARATRARSGRAKNGKEKKGAEGRRPRRVSSVNRGERAGALVWRSGPRTAGRY